MKISYNVLKRYIKNLKNSEDLAKDLIMHTAEVEDIVYSGENLKDVFIGEVLTCSKHTNSDKLNCTTVKINDTVLPIVCGAPNVKAGIKVPVAIVGAKLKENFVIEKATIRGEISEGMICSEDELGLVKERQEGIMILPEDAPIGMNFGEYIGKNDIILEIDNKAINHRPDLFSHIGIAREIQAINGKKLEYNYEKKDFSNLPDLGIKNEIPEYVSRYMGIKIDNVKNISSPSYIKEVLGSAGVNSKGLLVDITNYCLYFYGQPTHAFDTDKIEGNITVRFAKKGEKFIALNDCEYELIETDIVIADTKKVLALGGVIGGKESSVSDSTKSIILESANFDQAIIRKTGKRLGVRTDSLNVFEKDIVNGMQLSGASLIISELEKNISGIKLSAYSDIYNKKQEEKSIEFDLDFINRLIGKKYSKEEALEILGNLGIEISGNTLIIPFWRKDLNYKADIAEEIARITGYDKIESTLPRVEIKAVTQSNIYKLKNDVKKFFTNNGYYDMYTYSFVNEELMNKCLSDTKGLVDMKNALSEELTHLRGSVIPNLLLSLEKNSIEYENLKLFEIEKVFNLSGKDINEKYSIGLVQVFNDIDIVYYEIQNVLSNFLNGVGTYDIKYTKTNNIPKYAHPSRTAGIVINGIELGVIGEIHPKVANNFGINDRIGFFEINADILKDNIYLIQRAKEVSQFQENNFDLNFVISKDTETFKIKDSIINTSDLITKVELIDIYENENKLKGKRSITFKIYIQSIDRTLDDNDKAKLITDITSSVLKLGGELRSI